MMHPSNGMTREVPPLPGLPTREELVRDGINIAVSVPMERNVSDAAFIGFWNLARQGWPIIDHLYGRTDSNRNRSAKFILDNPEYTHLVMLDADHMHPRDTVLKLARWVQQNRDLQVVSGLHFRRGEPYDPCCYIYQEDGDLHAPVDWQPGLMEVDAVGHGSILISREVFEVLPTPWWAYSYNHAREFIYPSEDMYFSHLCRQFGIKMWVDTTQTSPHLITSAVEESSYRKFLEDHPEQVTAVPHNPNGKVKKARVIKPAVQRQTQWAGAAMQEAAP